MLESFGEHRWLLWAVASAVLACTEMLSGEFTLLMLAAGAGAGAITAAIVPGMWLLQVIVAAVVAALLLTVLRPTLLATVRSRWTVKSGRHVPWNPGRLSLPGRKLRCTRSMVRRSWYIQFSGV